MEVSAMLKRYYYIEANSKECIGHQRRLTQPKKGKHVWIPMAGRPIPFTVAKIVRDAVFVAQINPLDLEKLYLTGGE